MYHNIDQLKKTIISNLKLLEFHSSKDAFAQWLWRRRFLNFVNVFSLYCYYLPLEKGMALHLKKLISPSPKDALCQALAQWFWRGRFLNSVK